MRDHVQHPARIGRLREKRRGQSGRPASGRDELSFAFTPRPHWELGESLNILDFTRGAKITGARFTLPWARRAAGAGDHNFMLDSIREHGLHRGPHPLHGEPGEHDGHGAASPSSRRMLFRIDAVDYFLIPTAEVPVTNIHRDEILGEKELPIYYVAYSPASVRRAGSYGKDTRGLIRQHHSTR